MEGFVRMSKVKVIISASLYPYRALLSLVQTSSDTQCQRIYFPAALSYNSIMLMLLYCTFLCQSKLNPKTDASHCFVHVLIDAVMVFLSLALNFCMAAANA